MKLRIAKKICNNIYLGQESRYTAQQCHRAICRVERSRFQRQANAFFHALMARLGVLGRAQVLADIGAPEMAFDLLMRTPVSEWTYGPKNP